MAGILNDPMQLRIHKSLSQIMLRSGLLYSKVVPLPFLGCISFAFLPQFCKISTAFQPDFRNVSVVTTRSDVHSMHLAWLFHHSTPET